MLISPEEIKKSLSSSQWQYLNGKIIKRYDFANYMEGVSFVQKIAELAEKHNHHPDIIIGYCTMEISISSHQMNGVTTKCVNLATAINTL
jgi:4a-hydroxytetrahydrobiopterin dehydratase